METKLHSANEIDNLVSVRLVLVNGAWCHFWSDGLILPALHGGAGDDDDSGDDSGAGDDDTDDSDGTGDDDESGDDGGDDDDEDGDDDDDDVKSLKKARQRIHKLSQEAAKNRIQRNSARKERDEALGRETALKAELAKIKKEGVTDEQSKADMKAKDDRIAELERENDKLSRKELERKIERSVTEEMADLGLVGDIDFVIAKLRKNGQLEVDEDGDIDELTASLKKLAKKHPVEITKRKSASGDKDEDGASGNGASRSGRSVNGRRGNKGEYDKVALAKKYPALRH